MTMTMMMVKDDDKNDGGKDEVGVGELRHSCICIPDLLWGSKWKIRVEVDSGWWWRCWWRSWWWWWWLSWIWHRFDENHNFLSQKLSGHGKRGQFWIWRQNWFGAFSKQLNSFFDLSWSFLRCSFVDFDKYIQECVSMGKQKRLIVTTITNNPIAFLSQFNIN